MFRFIIKAISNALGFSKVEARGTLMLIFVMILGISFSRVYVNVLKNPTIPGPDQFEDLEAWVAEVEASYELKAQAPSNVASTAPAYPTKRKYAVANPNVETNENVAAGSIQSPSPIPEPIVLLDLNEATEEELQKVRGIGPTYARRIVNFRDLLGGFYQNAQLREVYGLPDETIVEVQKYFSVLSLPRPIPINVDSAKVLAAHPYITYDLAWIIINYRKQNGNISSSEDLKKIQAIDHETFARLKPYLD